MQDAKIKEQEVKIKKYSQKSLEQEAKIKKYSQKSLESLLFNVEEGKLKCVVLVMTSHMWAITMKLQQLRRESSFLHLTGKN